MGNWDEKIYVKDEESMLLIFDTLFKLREEFEKLNDVKVDNDIDLISNLAHDVFLELTDNLI